MNRSAEKRKTFEQRKSQAIAKREAEIEKQKLETKSLQTKLSKNLGIFTLLGLAINATSDEKPCKD